MKPSSRLTSEAMRPHPSWQALGDHAWSSRTSGMSYAGGVRIGDEDAGLA
ncbi:MAG: hypothetical protein ACLUNV_04135 [Sutterella wadsworthensis]